MFDHVGLHVLDLQASVRLYASLLAHFQASITYQDDNTVGFTAPNGQALYLIRSKDPGAAHVALAANSRAAVDAFYRDAIKRGGRDNGAPGLRPGYGPTYYAAFIVDADGDNVEAVFNK